ncbi:MAG: FkbM family methyltransferase [Bacteroidota bacterium]
MSLIAKLARLKRKIIKTPPIKDKRLPTYWLHQLLIGRTAFVCQIGSNDGKTGDPLYDLLQKNKEWKALFVEPVPYLFDKLKINYGTNHRFTFENVAINNGDKLTFYWVDPQAKKAIENLPPWYDQLGSFDKQHILNHLDGKLAPFILSEELECITLPHLLERNQIARVDILHIDTEGYDWNILSQFDFKKYATQFILFEKRHLSTEEVRLANDYLKSQFQLFDLGMDMLAVSKSIGDSKLTEMERKMKFFDVAALSQ